MELVFAALLGVVALRLIDEQPLIATGLGLACLALLWVGLGGAPASDIFPMLAVVEVMLLIGTLFQSTRPRDPSARP